MLEVSKGGFCGGVKMSGILDELKFEVMLENIKQLMQNLNITADKALAVLGVPETERQKYIAAL